MLKNCNFSKAKVQGKRIINVFSIKLAFRHGFMVQNRGCPISIFFVIYRLDPKF